MLSRGQLNTHFSLATTKMTVLIVSRDWLIHIWQLLDVDQ
jgi:hypothetical protein